MADPRQLGPQQRRSNFSALMQALVRRSAGETVNFCPFGCEDRELDEHGFCGHLVGFYDGGQTYEPRMRLKNGRIITSGKARKPMEKGFKLVKITTSARVYSPQVMKHLIVARDDSERQQAEILEQERQLMEAADRIRNPVLEGDWGETAYDIAGQNPAAAAT